MVGTFGKAGLRSALVTASGFNLPPLIKPIAGGKLSNIKSTSFAITATFAKEEPR